MALEDFVQSIQEFDLEQLNDFNRVGSWPLAIKILIWVVFFVGALVAGYFFHVTKLMGDLATVQGTESTLRSSYEEKAERAAHLNSYRLQQLEMEKSFGALLSQLPSDTEIPGLIEDITLVGLENGLSFNSIDLQPEVKKEFYIEKPIQIVVAGGYHDLGSFVSDVADLSRIVTLHDFTISPVGSIRGGGGGEETGQGGLLRMSITARTYRYSDDG